MARVFPTKDDSPDSPLESRSAEAVLVIPSRYASAGQRGLNINCSRWSLMFSAAARPGAGDWEGSRHGRNSRTGSLTVRRLRLEAPPASLERHYALCNAARRGTSTRWTCAVAFLALLFVAFTSDNPAMYRYLQVAVGGPGLAALFALSFFPAAFNRSFEAAAFAVVVLFSLSQRTLYVVLVGDSPHLLLVALLVFWAACSLLGFRFHVSAALSALLVLEFLLPSLLLRAGGVADALAAFSPLGLASCVTSGALAVGASYLRDRNERRLFFQELQVVRADAEATRRGRQASASAAAAPLLTTPRGAVASSSPSSRQARLAGPPPRPGPASSSAAAAAGLAAPPPPPLRATTPRTALEATEAAAAALAAAELALSEAGSDGAEGAEEGRSSARAPPAGPPPASTATRPQRGARGAPPRGPPLVGGRGRRRRRLGSPSGPRRRRGRRPGSGPGAPRRSGSRAASHRSSLAGASRRGSSRAALLIEEGEAAAEETPGDPAASAAGTSARRRRSRALPQLLVPVAQGSEEDEGSVSPVLSPGPVSVRSLRAARPVSFHLSDVLISRSMKRASIAVATDDDDEPGSAPRPRARRPPPPPRPRDRARARPSPKSLLRRAVRRLFFGRPLEPPELEAGYRAYYADLTWRRLRLLCPALVPFYLLTAAGSGLLPAADRHAPPLSELIRPRRLVPYGPLLVSIAFLVGQVSRLIALRRVILTFDPAAAGVPSPEWTPEFWNKLSHVANFSFLSSAFWLPLRVAALKDAAMLALAAAVLVSSSSSPLRYLVHFANFLLAPSAIAAVACSRSEHNARRRYCIENGVLHLL
eukprot:tig00000760_g3924.t1